VFTSILCPVDFSSFSERALGLAAGLARHFDANLTIVHVVDTLLDAAAQASGNQDVELARIRQTIDEGLNRVCAGKESELRAVTSIVLVGDPAEQVLEHARDSNADVIVMGTQGLGGAKRLVFGSTTDQVLRGSDIPVLAVPGPHDAS
jgi:nucleotide-binding universal stress UspA family protein